MTVKVSMRFSSCVALLICVTPLAAEQGILVVHIEDLRGRPIAGVRLRAGAGSSISSPDSFGAARIRLAMKTKPGDVVMLEVLAIPKNKDLVMISPWDKWVHVPPFENESKNFVPAVLVEWGDKACLENPACIRAAVAQINRANAPKAAGEQSGEDQRKEALATVAKGFGLKPEEIDQAVRAWGAKTEDPYDKGLAALYEKHYPEASRELALSLDRRKSAETKAQSDVADVASFLGQSLYEQGHYRQSAEAYEETANRRPDDGATLSNLGLSWFFARNYAKAEPRLRRALAIGEKELGPDHPDVATSLNNLASLLAVEGDYARAEPLLRRALAISEKALGPDHPDMAGTLNNLGVLLKDREDYAGAEPLLRRALAVKEKALGADHPDVARTLNNLAVLLKNKGDYAGAEPLHRRALAIREKALGPDHPDFATSLDDLALLMQAKGDYAAAEPLCRRALAIREKALGPDHPDVATSLDNLALLMQAKGDYAGAEPLYHRALAIREKALGPDHPDVAASFNYLALLLRAQGDNAGAEPLYRRALAIYEKALGPDHPSTKRVRANLQSPLKPQ